MADAGAEKVHRRSLYTFWKRTSAPPQMTTFDAPSREACTVRRERTNTPLQALLLMNEPQFVEASRGLAERTLREAGLRRPTDAPDVTVPAGDRADAPTRGSSPSSRRPSRTFRPTTPASPTPPSN